VTLGQLSDLRYVSLGTDTATYRHVERTLRSAGIALETTAVVSDPVMAIFMVELGQGSTFVPAVQAEPAERRGLARALRIEGLPPLDMGWAARRFDRLPRATLRFLEIFERYVRRIGRRSRRSR
jgi:DNA-binding transcriptional LysR family regulator